MMEASRYHHPVVLARLVACNGWETTMIQNRVDSIFAFAFCTFLFEDTGRVSRSSCTLSYSFFPHLHAYAVIFPFATVCLPSNNPISKNNPTHHFRSVERKQPKRTHQTTKVFQPHTSEEGAAANSQLLRSSRTCLPEPFQEGTKTACDITHNNNTEYAVKRELYGVLYLLRKKRLAKRNSFLPPHRKIR